MSVDEEDTDKGCMVLFPPPGIVKSSAKDLLSSFAVFRGDRKLRVGSHCVAVLEDVLSSRSTYFSTMFSGVFKESTEGGDISIMDVPDEGTFFHVLYYLMTGTMRDLTLQNFAAIVANADFVQSEPLTEYLQQVALAYHKELFKEPSFKSPQITVDFLKGFIRIAKTANKINSLFQAASLFGGWLLEVDDDQAKLLVDYTRELFPMAPRSRKAQIPRPSRKGGGKGEQELMAWQAAELAWVAAEKERKLADERHHFESQRVSFDFVNAMLKHPHLLGMFNAQDALLALESALDNSTDNDYYRLEQKRREAIVKMRKLTKANLKKLLTQLCEKGAPVEEEAAPPSSEHDGVDRYAANPLLIDHAAHAAALSSFEHYDDYGDYDGDLYGNYNSEYGISD